MNKSKPHKQRARKKNVAPSTKGAANPSSPVGERIQKVLARGGVASRREIESWIEDGKFILNGKPATLGDRLKTGDRLQLNGRVIHWEKYMEQPPRVLIYHKPIGEVVTRNDPQGRPVIFTQLPKISHSRWIAVGRLDINTQGLLLVTNNGELAHRLMHPSTEMEREYAVRVLGEVNDELLARLKTGVALEDGPAHFDDIQFSGGEGANKWYHVVVKEGRNRLVRRLWESQGITVSRLMRVRYGPVVLPNKIKAHTFYEMNDEEIASLMEYVGMKQSKRHSRQTPKTVYQKRRQ